MGKKLKLTVYTKSELMSMAEEHYRKTGKVVDRELKPSEYREFFIDVLKLSRSTAFRILSSNNMNQQFSVGWSRRRQKNEFDYTYEQQRKIFGIVYSYLHDKKLKSGDRITAQMIDEITNIVNQEMTKEDPSFVTNNRYISCVVLGIETDEYKSLFDGSQKSTNIFVGLGYKDDMMAQNVAILQKLVFEEFEKKEFTTQDIENMSRKSGVPVSIILRKVFNATDSQIKIFRQNGKIILSDNTHFFDFPDNLPRRLQIDDPLAPIYSYEKRLTTIEGEVFTEEDLSDSLMEDVAFYELKATDKDSLIRELAEKRKQVRKRYESLQKKYEPKLEIIVDQISRIEIQKDENGNWTQSSLEALRPYIKQLKEIILRCPAFYVHGNPSLLNFNAIYLYLKNKSLDVDIIVPYLFDFRKNSYFEKVNAMKNGSKSVTTVKVERPNIPKADVITGMMFDLIKREVSKGARVGGVRDEVGIDDIVSKAFDIFHEKGLLFLIHGGMLNQNDDELEAEVAEEEEIINVMSKICFGIGRFGARIYRSEQIKLRSLDEMINNPNVKNGPQKGEKTLGDMLGEEDKEIERINNEGSVEEHRTIAGVAEGIVDEMTRKIFFMMAKVAGQIFERYPKAKPGAVRARALEIVAKKMHISVSDIEERLNTINNG